VADADASVYTTLLEGYSPGPVYGEPTRGRGRGIHDITEAAKLKHWLYVMGGSTFLKAWNPIADYLGIARERHVFIINALLAGINVGLVLATLVSVGLSPLVSVWAWMLLNFAIGPWIVGSLPESWTLAGTTVLLVILITVRARRPLLWSTIVVAVGMLNCSPIGLALLIPALALSQHGLLHPNWIGRLFVSGTACLLLFMGLLLCLSTVEPGMRPDRMWELSSFFNRRMSNMLANRAWPQPFTSTAVLLSMPHFAVSSFVAYQREPSFGPLTFLRSIQNPQGAVGVAAFLTMAAFVVVTIWRKRGNLFAGNSERLLVALLTFVVGWFVITHKYYWPASPLFSPVHVSVLVVAGALALRGISRRWLFIGLLLATIVAETNFRQVTVVRRQLHSRSMAGVN